MVIKHIHSIQRGMSHQCSERRSLVTVSILDQVDHFIIVEHHLKPEVIGMSILSLTHAFCTGHPVKILKSPL